MMAREYSDSSLAVKTKWNMEAEYIQSCNCDWGCPCNFDALPTHGSSEALVAYRANREKFRDTKLHARVFAEGLWRTKAIHDGTGIVDLHTAETPSANKRNPYDHN